MGEKKESWEENVTETMRRMNYEIEKLRTLVFLLPMFLDGEGKGVINRLAEFIEEIRDITLPIIPELGVSRPDALLNDIANDLRHTLKSWKIE